MSERKPFSFKEQYAKGKMAEGKFLGKHPGLAPLSGRKGEYYIRLTMDKVELKTDFYDMAKTNNCFIELSMQYASGTRESGVFQAIEHGCKYFVYWFIENDCEFWFRPEALRDLSLSWWRDRLDLRREIVNRSDEPPYGRYSAHGILMPRSELQKIVIPSPI